MKFCPKCGSANTNDCNKCSCGEDLSQILPANATASNEAKSKPPIAMTESTPFMNSATCKSLILLFIVLAVVGALICLTVLDSVGYAVVVATVFIETAVIFAALGGLLKNQETQNELLKELINEMKNKQ